jgi:hypothetical protein
MPTPRDECNTGRHGRVMQFPSLTNETVITQYIAYRMTTGRRWRSETVKSRTSQVRALAAYLDPTPLVDATEDQILIWHQQLTGQPETIAAHISAARGLYRWMAVYSRPRLRQDDPTVILERPRIPVAQPRPMLDRHYDLALACAVSQPEMYLWLGLMGCSGLRCCEIAWMHTGDIEPRDDSSALLHITGKGGKRRTVPAGAMLMLTMRPFLTGMGPVFTRPTDGRAQVPRRRRDPRPTPGTQPPAPLRHRLPRDRPRPVPAGEADGARLGRHHAALHRDQPSRGRAVRRAADPPSAVLAAGDRSPIG